MAYRFHKEGTPTLIWTLIISFLAFILSSFFYSKFPWVTYVVLSIDIFLIVMVLQFFRNPHREIPVNIQHVLSPADGKVVVIETVQENEYLRTECIKISVFMSPVNVHVNRYPVSGTVAYFRYHPGKFLAAWEPKSSLDNERTTVVVKSEKGTVLFRQIAGALARRIVWYCKEGDNAMQGAEMGFIKLGSRVDVYVPVQSKVLVKIGQKVLGGITPLAEFI
jgi:phosphatidylserine decarboxylase